VRERPHAEPDLAAPVFDCKEQLSGVHGPDDVTAVLADVFRAEILSIAAEEKRKRTHDIIHIRENSPDPATKLVMNQLGSGETSLIRNVLNQSFVEHCNLSFKLASQEDYEDH
jgi:hypothetical protein